jgi:hypothetical protein
VAFFCTLPFVAMIALQRNFILFIANHYPEKGVRWNSL